MKSVLPFASGVLIVVSDGKGPLLGVNDGAWGLSSTAAVPTAQVGKAEPDAPEPKPETKAEAVVEAKEPEADADIVTEMGALEEQ
jgi:hypothetical protein